jgi:cytochrome b pre-mRNA-processing protein 3
MADTFVLIQCLILDLHISLPLRRWYGPGWIGRDFRSYQAVLTMHLWFLHKRLINDNTDPLKAALIQEELFDIFWTDSSNRMRAHGVNEWLIGKNLKTVQQYTFMHLFHYDHCYTGELLDDPAARFEELKNLVKTHILLLSPDDEQSLKLHDDQSERIAWYIETQYQNIVHDLPDPFYRKARIAWCDLPDFTGLIDGNTGHKLPDQPINQDDVLPDGWVKNVANDGTYYYWNFHTRKAQWERP